MKDVRDRLLTKDLPETCLRVVDVGCETLKNYDALKNSHTFKNSDALEVVGPE